MAVPSGKQKPSFTCPKPLLFKYRVIPDTVDCFQNIFSVEINEVNFIAKKCRSFGFPVSFCFVCFYIFRVSVKHGVFMGMPIFSASNRFRFGSPKVYSKRNLSSWWLRSQHPRREIITWNIWPWHRLQGNLGLQGRSGEDAWWNRKICSWQFLIFSISGPFLFLFTPNFGEMIPFELVKYHCLPIEYAYQVVLALNLGGNDPIWHAHMFHFGWQKAAPSNLFLQQMAMRIWLQGQWARCFW